MNIRMTIKELETSLNNQIDKGLVTPTLYAVTEKIVNMIQNSGVLSEDSEVKSIEVSNGTATVAMGLANELTRIRVLLISVPYGEVDITEGYEVSSYANEWDTLEEILNKTHNRLYELALLTAIIAHNAGYYDGLSYIAEHTRLYLSDLLEGNYDDFKRLSEWERNFIKSAIKDSDVDLPESFIGYAERFFEGHRE